MILAVDIGNTNIVVGYQKAAGICFVERMSTEATRTELEYAISFKNVLWKCMAFPLSSWTKGLFLRLCRQ